MLAQVELIIASQDRFAGTSNPAVVRFDVLRRPVENSDRFKQ
jgi:hypothetical protein